MNEPFCWRTLLNTKSLGSVSQCRGLHFEQLASTPFFENLTVGLRVRTAQYISTGNLGKNNKAFLFLMDYPHRRRIKIWGTAEIIEDDIALMQKLNEPDYGAVRNARFCSTLRRGT